MTFVRSSQKSCVVLVVVPLLAIAHPYSEINLLIKDSR